MGTARILIDGRAVSPSEVAALFQRDPHPGGLVVEAVLDIDPHRELFRSFPRTGALDLTMQQSRELVMIFGMFYVESGPKLSCFVNQFTRAEFFDTQVRLVGIASPIVR